MNVTVYTPNQRQKIGFFETLRIMTTNIINSRILIKQLFIRDFVMAYKKSFLGFSWVLISPLIGIVSWVFLNSANVLQPGSTPIPYLPYVLLSSSLWGLFMGFYGSAVGTLGAGSGFIMQVKYPHEVLLVKQIAQQVANFLITFVLNIVVLLLFGIVPHWSIIFLPILVIPMFFFAAGLGLIISLVSVVASDLSNIVGIALGFVFYATPIIYTADALGEPYRTVIKLNPLTYLVGGVRDLILIGHMDHPDRFIISAIAAFIFFLLAWRFFYVSEDKVIEKLI